MSTSSVKRKIRRFHVVVVQWTSKKCTKKRDARAGLGGGGVTRYFLGWGGAARSPNTLTLLKTKITDFPTLFKTEFRFLIPCLRHLTRNHTLCKTIINKNFAVV